MGFSFSLLSVLLTTRLQNQKENQYINPARNWIIQSITAGNILLLVLTKQPLGLNIVPILIQRIEWDRFYIINNMGWIGWFASNLSIMEYLTGCWISPTLIYLQNNIINYILLQIRK